MKFQIKQSYNDGSGGWLYFETDITDIAELKKLAIREVNNEWNEFKEVHIWLHTTKPCRPTIYVCEYDIIKNKKVKNGLTFKTKWR